MNLRNQSVRTTMRAILYSRVSTSDQNADAQFDQMREMAGYKKYNVIAEISDVISGTRDKRPGLDRALELLSTGEADILVVSRLDRLGRSVTGILGLFARAQSEGWSIAIRDLDLDTSTPSGQLTLVVLAGMASFERQLISARTKEALQALKDRGVVLGSAPTPEAVAAPAIALREKGLSYAAICDVLNEQGHKTMMGCSWNPSQVERVCRRAGVKSVETPLERKQRMIKEALESK